MPNDVRRQSSFTGGELDPELHGRVDSARYGQSLRHCRNFLPVRGGALVNRPGLRYLGESMLGTAVRLVAFSFAEDEALVLEFGAGFIRFWQNGALITKTTGLAAYNPATTYTKWQFCTYGGLTYRAKRTTVGDQPDTHTDDWEATDEYAVETTYALGDLAYLKFAQVGDVIRIACLGENPRTLTRVADDDWVLAALDFTAPAADFNAGIPMLEDVVDGDASHPEREWVWQVTAVLQYLDGTKVETAPFQVANLRSWGYPDYSLIEEYEDGDLVSYPGWTEEDRAQCYWESLQNVNVGNALVEGAWWHYVGETVIWPNYTTAVAPKRVAVYPDRPVTIRWPPETVIAEEGGGLYVVLYWRVYRGRGEVFGWLSDVADHWGEAGYNSWEDNEFTDYGDTPDISIQPPQGRNPFIVPPSSTAEQPRTVSFFDQRCVYGGTGSRPGGEFFSKVDSYDNFDRHVFPKLADDALEFGLASMRYEEIRSLLPLRRLLAFTSSNVWAIGGAANGEPLSPTSLDARIQATGGASWVDPVQVGSEALFIDAAMRKVRSVGFVAEAEAYLAPDLTAWAGHLFRSLADAGDLTAIAYAEQPDSVVWVLRADGTLRALTYDRANQVLAWSRHDCDYVGGDAGVVVSICTSHENGEDRLYAAVSRAGGVDIERMDSHQPETLFTSGYLDGYVTGAEAVAGKTEGVNILDSAGSPIAADVAIGATVRVTPSGGSTLVFSAAYQDQTIVLDPGGDGGGPLRILLVTYTDPYMVGTLVDALDFSELDITATVDWRLATNTIGGLGHLVGSLVYVWGVEAGGTDLSLQGPYTPEINIVTGDVEIETDLPVYVWHAGMLYTCELEAMDLPVEKHKWKSVARLFLEVAGYGGLEVAPDKDSTDWVDMSWPGTSLLYLSAPVHGFAEGRASNPWTEAGRVAVRTTLPVPTTIKALVREVDIGGR